MRRGGGDVGRYLRQGFLFPGNREGLLRGGLEPRWGQVRAGPGWGPQPTLSAHVPGCPKDLALVWSCGLLGSCSRALHSPVHPTDCSLSSPPWLLLQGAFPSGAGHCPCSPVTPRPHPLCCPSPLHSQGLFQKHKSAQSPGHGSQTLAK